VSELDLEGLVDGGGLVLIEWADRLAEPPSEAVVIRIEDLGGERRRIGIDWSTSSYSTR
jgi:tRNA A37 threonylcarbamoyladenosine biosynthesis protein TsaE